MSKRRKLTEDDLKAQLHRELHDAVGYLGSELTKDRAKALDYYYGRKTGLLRAEDGRSGVVSRDVLETVEWATAQLLQMFEGEKIASFDPENEDDVPNAEQETDYINHILMKDNDGFQLLHDWVKDGLLSRVGIMHAGWDDEPVSRIETYTGLLPEQLELLLSDEGTELVEKTVRQITVETPQGPQPSEVCDVRVRIEKKVGVVRICCIPPEEFRISRGLRSIEDAKRKSGAIVAHVFECDESALRNQGFTKDQIDRILGEDGQVSTDSETFARDNPEELGALSGNRQERTTAWVSRIFTKVDWDGDGKDELREIVYCAHEIASNEPAEEIPYADWCPVPMPHRFSGQSYADLVMDLQEIRTALMRGSLDNLYLANNPMKEVVDAQVNIKDLLTARIGGVVRVKQPGMIREIVTQPQLGQSLQMMEYSDTQRENRTGLTRYNQGLDAETLNKTASGMAQVLSQSQIRLRLVARLFAERGMKPLVRLIHGIVRRHQDVPRVVRLRNDFVMVDPREWRDRTNLTVNVGLGAGTRQEQIANMQQILQAQMGMMQAGAPFVQPQNIYNTLRAWTELLGHKDVQNFWTDPSQQPEQQPKEQPPDPKIIAAQMQAQIKQQELQARAQETQTQAQLKMAELQANHQFRMQQIQAANQNDAAKLNAQMAAEQRRFTLEQQKLAQDQQQFESKQMQEAVLTREKLKVDLMGHTAQADIEQKAVKALGG